jgi:(1->4)-alpha-D-glucan 1-alpha-D-glucosylmutase
VQLHPGFTFDEAAALADYVAELGVTHLYCSPYLQAEAGSTHGYDVVDHARINRELGGDRGHAGLVAALARHGLGQVLDIVPNHMATDGRANRWWWDVLENGPSSPYAAHFDIDWSSPSGSAGRVLVPILADHLGRVLEQGDIGLDRDGAAFVVRYHDHALPISPRTLDTVIAAAAVRAGDADLDDIADRLGRLPDAGRTDPEGVARRHRDKEVLAHRLAELCDRRPEVAAALDAELAELSGDVDRLDELLLRQNYRLAFWRTASEELDYRRFFNIETLVGLRMEDPAVFDDTHELVLALAARGVVDGFRVDHVDGLRDPAEYLRRLRDRSNHRWVVVEKILEHDEALPPGWAVEGTSGYDFVNRVNDLFVDPAGERAFTELWQRFTGDTTPYADIVHAAKGQIMRDELVVEVDRLAQLLQEVCERHRRHRDHTRRDLVRACRQLLAAYRVYRTYVVPEEPVSDVDRAVVADAVGEATERNESIDSELLAFVGEVLRLEHDGPAEHEFALRFQQVSAPVMAKGVEDTAFYRYHRLTSINEVGGDPGRFGGSVEEFHGWCGAVAARWPDTMLTLSTHDTKRSGDVRARLNVLSELPEAWGEATTRWRDLAHRHRRGGLPDRATEYLLYQTVVGAWPIDADRLAAFVEKATKEAKVATSWIAPDLDYDAAAQAFARGVVNDDELRADIERFIIEQRLVERGRVNALAQTALLLTCPGVPDIYQGSEVWDLSLVDPDNRRPVDYPRRRALLADVVASGDAGADAAMARFDDGAPKLWLVHRLLGHRRHHHDVYRTAGYHPLIAEGPMAAHAVAFARDDALVTLVPRLVTGLDGGWGDTTIELPGGRWTDLLAQVEVEGGRRRVADLLTRFPVSVLARER